MRWFFGRKKDLAPMEVSARAYDEIIAALHAGGYTHRVVDGALDLSGTVLVRGEAPSADVRSIGSNPKHSHLRNSAPGAI